MNLQENIRKILREENKKSGLLRAIEEDGLFQVMQDTGLSMGQIILKYDNLPREVFERYIKDIVSEKGFQMYEGFILLYDVEISHNKYTEHFYLKGDKVMVGIKEYGKHNEQISGGVEDLENLTDDEIYTIVDDMKDYME